MVCLSGKCLTVEEIESPKRRRSSESRPRHHTLQAINTTLTRNKLELEARKRGISPPKRRKEIEPFADPYANPDNMLAEFKSTAKGRMSPERPQPNNFDKEFRGSVDAREAGLEKSRNSTNRPHVPGELNRKARGLVQQGLPFRKQIGVELARTVTFQLSWLNLQKVSYEDVTATLDDELQLEKDGQYIRRFKVPDVKIIKVYSQKMPLLISVC
jgi:hypothetical protein